MIEELRFQSGNHCRKEIPDSGVIDYGKARIIEFTLDESTGRFGFLRTNPQGNAPQAKE